MFDDSQRPRTAVIVEDDPDVRHLLSEVLESAGFSTISVGNGIDGVRAVLTYKPLITTLDVNMPGIDGFEAARRIRAQSDTYIVMLTALDDEADVVLGLTAGADEYLNKPFRARELRARIDALLRRPRQAATASPRQEQSGPSFPGARPAQPFGEPAATASAPAYPSAPATDPAPAPATAAQSQSPSRPAPMPQATPPPAAERHPDPAPTAPFASAPERTIVLGPDGAVEYVAPTENPSQQPAAEDAWATHRDLRLNTASRVVLVRDVEVDLTRTEFDLLCALMESKRRVRSKADLTLVLRGESYVTSYFVGDADKRAIEAHMTNLRRKIGDNPVQPRYIETVRGVGYRLTAEVSS